MLVKRAVYYGFITATDRFNQRDFAYLVDQSTGQRTAKFVTEEEITAQSKHVSGFYVVGVRVRHGETMSSLMERFGTDPCPACFEDKRARFTYGNEVGSILQSMACAEGESEEDDDSTPTAKRVRGDDVMSSDDFMMQP